MALFWETKKGGVRDDASSALGIGRGALYAHDHFDRLRAQIKERFYYVELQSFQFIYWRGPVRLSRHQAADQQGRQKAYTHATAAALRMKESVIETVTTVQETPLTFWLRLRTSTKRVTSRERSLRTKKEA